MSEDKRTGWLAEIKVGDSVVVKRSEEYIKFKVDRITPTGMIVATQGEHSEKRSIRFGVDGYSASASPWAPRHKLLKVDAKTSALCLLTHSREKSRITLRAMKISDMKNLDNQIALSSCYLEELEKQKKIIDFVEGNIEG